LGLRAPTDALTKVGETNGKFRKDRRKNLLKRQKNSRLSIL